MKSLKSIMFIAYNKLPFRVTNSGFKVDEFDDFLPRGRSLLLIAETLSPSSSDVQQDFLLHPYPVELKLSIGEGVRFRREFLMCRWLDLLEQMGLRAAVEPSEITRAWVASMWRNTSKG